jgi:hypothetical protein
MFDELRAKAGKIVVDSNSVDEAVRKIMQLVSSETASRSKTILSDMLFDLNDSLLQTAFFHDIITQNKFIELNLRQEILNKYQFSVSTTVDYQEAARVVQALKIGGATFVIGGIAEIGVVLKVGLSISNLVPIPVSILVVAALGAALVDYLAIEPNRSKKKFSQKLDSYLIDVQNQFLNWFDGVESYYNNRVEEIKLTL